MGKLGKAGREPEDMVSKTQRYTVVGLKHGFTCTARKPCLMIFAGS